MINRIRGTQDHLDMTLRDFISNQLSQILINNNFSHIQTPILEPTSLFKHSLGQHTDVVNKEMFLVAGNDDMCLRPEATASTMRAFLQDGNLMTPWKVFSYGSMFRYERPQKGRYREFSQINMEVIGTSAIEQDAHFLYMLDRFFADTLKLNNYILHLNFLGSLDDRQQHRQALATFLEKHISALCETCVKRSETNMLRIFDCKHESCQKIYQAAPLLTDYLSKESQTEWEQLQESLMLTSVNFVHNPHLVRGLDYYYNTVFEFVSDELGAQNAFCGGGRWNLSQTLESKTDYPSLGAALGVDRLVLLLESSQTLTLPQKKALTVIIPVGALQKNLALLVAHDLLRHNKCVDMLLSDSSIGNRMKKANRMGARYVVVIGDEERVNGTVTVKNMVTGEQKVVKQVELYKEL